MPKQKSRVYQRCPGIVGDQGRGLGLEELGFELKGLDSFAKVPPKTENVQVLPTSKPSYSRLFVCCMVLLVLLSLVSGVGLPILSVILTEVPFRFTFWFPALAVLMIWFVVIGLRMFEFFYSFLFCYFVPLYVFYTFGNFKLAGVIDWPWYRVCISLYPMIISVPASYFIMKHLEKLRHPS
jgi:hypothetical protein